MPPWRGGGEMIREVKKEAITFADLPSRFEAGTPNIVQAVGLGHAIDYFDSKINEGLFDYEEDIAKFFHNEIQSIKNIKVYGKGSKERLIPIMSQTLKSISSHIIDRPVKSDDLFVTDAGKSLYPSFVYRRVNYYLSMVSSLHKCSPHVLRHTFATHLLNNGAELAAVKELLGHASLSSTQVYTHHTMAKLKEFHRASPLDRRSEQGD